jgi:hypothetical protein
MTVELPASSSSASRLLLKNDRVAQCIGHMLVIHLDRLTITVSLIAGWVVILSTTALVCFPWTGAAARAMSIAEMVVMVLSSIQEGGLKGSFSEKQ